MKVIKAKTAGFCFGVKRAVDTVYKQVDTKCGQIYTYGPIIHNEEVIKDMRDKGVSYYVLKKIFSFRSAVKHSASSALCMTVTLSFAHPFIPTTSGCSGFPIIII